MLFGLLRTNRDWMASTTARHRFLAFSIVALAGFTFLLCASYAAGWETAIRDSTILGAAALAVGAATALAILGIFIGMLWCCINLDTSRWYSKVLWSLFFVIALPFGSIIYYFLVYRRWTGQPPRETPTRRRLSHR